jgi:1,6-anhydro-N-acetylmuramate kinase
MSSSAEVIVPKKKKIQATVTEFDNFRAWRRQHNPKRAAQQKRELQKLHIAIAIMFLATEKWQRHNATATKSDWSCTLPNNI